MKPTFTNTGLTLLSLLASTGASLAQSLAEIEAAAKAEGQLTVIALEHEWCNYGGILAGFKAKYPEINITELDPDAGSADELEAVRSNKGNMGPQVPDVIDVGLAFGPQAQGEGLLAPYKVSTWETIPSWAKEAEGHWVGDYYGVVSFAVNKDLVANTPASWADLKKPEYKGQVALAGDPRTSNNAILSIMSAGVSTGAAPGAESGEAGLVFFEELAKLGHFVPVGAGASTIAQGATPIAINWDYNNLSQRDGLGGNPPVEVVIPSDAVIAGLYVQGISAYAPHPNAAKLWMEYLYSDAGQLGFLEGYCHPVRFDDLAARGVIPGDLLAKLPDPAAYKKAVLPSLEAQAAHKEIVSGQWEKRLGAPTQ